jgi:hypothetical protein
LSLQFDCVTSTLFYSHMLTLSFHSELVVFFHCATQNYSSLLGTAVLVIVYLYNNDLMH